MHAKSNYAIIDQGRCQDIPPDLPCLSLCPVRLRGNRKYMPLLLPLDGISIMRKDELVADVGLAFESKLHPPLFETLFYCPLPPDIVRHHLSERLITKIAGHDFFLRYYDPYVMAQLLWILDPVQLRLIFGGIAEPSIITWALFIEGRWLTAKAPELPAKIVEPDPIECLKRIKNVSLINGALPYWPGAKKGLTELATAGQEIHRLLQTGRIEFKLSHDLDLLTFVKHGLLKHGQFYQHTLIRRILSGSYLQAKDYFYKSSVLTDEDWVTVINDLNAGPALGETDNGYAR